MGLIKTISPVDGSVYVERAHASEQQRERAISDAFRAQRDWRTTPLPQRARLLEAFVNELLAERDVLAEQLTWQMGRPIRDAPAEFRGFAERATHMIEIAGATLADIALPPRGGFVRFIRREPLGVVLVLAPWNYPYLTAVNAVVPALMAGNAVLLKHSAQTPLVAEAFDAAGRRADLPRGLLQYLHLDHGQVSRTIADARIAHVCFTGSVEGGRDVHRAAAERFIAVGLELGGKDPAYVRADAPFEHAVETVVDGAFYNAGQSCCGIERVYVHDTLYDDFVEAVVAAVNRYKLGNPLDPSTTLGPVARASAAQVIRAQVASAVSAGARALIDEARFEAAQRNGPYLAPQVLVDVDHTMEIMCEETFGPVVGIMRVSSDEQAIALMNDSRYGLSAAIFTSDLEAAMAIGDRIETGTWYMNRCDYLDPALAWVGVKDTGRGCTLSTIGYEHLTRPKSFHLRTEVA